MNDFLESIIKRDPAAKTKLSIILTYPGAKALTSKYGFFSESPIPSGTYEGVDAVNTVAVGAQWFTSAKEDTDLIYKITKALWNKESRKLMDVGHAKGKTITPEVIILSPLLRFSTIVLCSLAFFCCGLIKKK